VRGEGGWHQNSRNLLCFGAAVEATPSAFSVCCSQPTLTGSRLCLVVQLWVLTPPLLRSLRHLPNTPPASAAPHGLFVVGFPTSGRACDGSCPCGISGKINFGFLFFGTSTASSSSSSGSSSSSTGHLSLTLRQGVSGYEAAGRQFWSSWAELGSGNSVGEAVPAK